MVRRKNGGVQNNRRPRLKDLSILRRDTGIDEVDAADVAVRRFGNITAAFYVGIHDCDDVPDRFSRFEDFQCFFDGIAGDPVELLKLGIRRASPSDELSPVTFQARADLHHHAVAGFHPPHGWGIGEGKTIFIAKGELAGPHKGEVLFRAPGAGVCFDRRGDLVFRDTRADHFKGCFITPVTEGGAFPKEIRFSGTS
jgi:hypothetical protein